VVQEPEDRGQFAVLDRLVQADYLADAAGQPVLDASRSLPLFEPGDTIVMRFRPPAGRRST
jgi:hypothetical protein